MRNTMRTILVWLFLAGVLLASAQTLLGKREDKQLINYSQFIQQVNKGEVTKVDIEGTLLSGYVIKGERTDKSKFYTNAPMDDKLLTMLQEKNVDFRYIPEEKPGLWSNIFFTSLLPVLLLIGAWFYFLRMQNGGLKGPKPSFPPAGWYKKKPASVFVTSKIPAGVATRPSFSTHTE